VGTINVHLRSEVNRSLLCGILEDLEIDICGVVETWFDTGTSIGLMNRLFGWFGVERKAKYSVYFIGVVYLPPATSGYLRDLKGTLLELETDIARFRKDGKVILLGDFNCRVSNQPSVILNDGKLLTLSRHVEDTDFKGSAIKSRATQFLRTLNAVNMVVMNGIDSGGNYTFSNSLNESSMIDYIILSDNILFPNTEDLSIAQPDQTSGHVQASARLPSDSEYILKSTKVHVGYKYQIGDHFLISCIIRLNAVPPNILSSLEDELIPIDIIKWDRRDNGNPAFWQPMQLNLENKLQTWDLKQFSQTDIDTVVEDFNFAINTALSESLRVRTLANKSVKQLNWNPEVFKARCEQKTAYENFKAADEKSKLICANQLMTAKKRLKKCIRKATFAQTKKLVESIEKLRSKDPGEYWKRLYQLDNTKVPENAIPVNIKNTEGKLVNGKEASQAWLDSFRRLGLEESDFYDFDQIFFSSIKSKVIEYSHQIPQDNKVLSELDQEIRLQEVKIAISNAKRGKAVGIDGIMNEVFKYGNEQTTTYLWKLFSRVFQSEHFPETWSQGLIFPLFKGGPISARTDVGKYRGITLLSIIGKIYTDILNQRVSLWMEKECLLSDEQACFRRARSTRLFLN